MKITPLVTGRIETWMHLHARPIKYQEKTRISVPITCYLLEHKGKKFLFDAGQRKLGRVQDPLENYVIKVKEEEYAVSLLAAMGIVQKDLDGIILSHNHDDHFAGLADFPDTKVMAQKPVAEALKHFRNEFIILDGEHDVLGDGAIRCIPTPGHVPGHQSLLVKMDDGSQQLLIGDVVYLPEALDYEPSEDEYAENPDMFDSIRKVRQLREDGVKLVYGHDPYFVVS